MEGYSARPSAFRPDARTQERPEDLSDFQRAGSVRLAADQRASPVPQCMTDLSADIRTCSDNIYYQHIPAFRIRVRPLPSGSYRLTCSDSFPSRSFWSVLSSQRSGSGRPLPSGSYRLPAYCLVCLLMFP